MPIYPSAWLDSIQVNDNSIASRQSKDLVLAVAAELEMADYEDELPQVQTWRILNEAMSTLTIDQDMVGD